MCVCVFTGPNLCRRSPPSSVPTATRSTSSPTVAPPSASSASSSPYCPPRTSAFAPGWASEVTPRPSCLCPLSPVSWRSLRASDTPSSQNTPSSFKSPQIPRQTTTPSPKKTTLICENQKKFETRKQPFCSKRMPSACQLSSL